MSNCPECGATDNLCQERFDEFLVLEFTDPAYGVVHSITVATYMLQHSSKMTREGWLYERDLLRDFIVHKKSPAAIRKQIKDNVDSGKRTFKFKSRDGKRIIDKSTWKKTILDVHTDDGEIYCREINTWARSVLEEAEAIAI